MYIRIYNLQTDDSFAGHDALIRAMMEAIGCDGAGGLNVGFDVVYMNIPGKIMAVQGVRDFDVQIGTSMENLGWKNIQIGIRQKAVADEGSVIIG